MSLFSGLSSMSTVPAGSLAKASWVGAKTVNGPGLFSVSTRPAAFTAATRVVWSAELTALSTMSLVGYIAAPPTMGLPAKAIDVAKAHSAIRAKNLFFTALGSFRIELSASMGLRQQRWRRIALTRNSFLQNPKRLQERTGNREGAETGKSNA